MDIGLYIENIRNDIDYSDADRYNPGVGGTQFLFLELAFYLEKHSDYRIHLITNTDLNQKLKCNYIVVSNIFEAIDICSKNAIDLLVIRGPIYNKKIAEALVKNNVRAIIWSHNFESYPSIRIAEKCPNIIKYVCVSQEQCDLFIDTELNNKSCYIWNSLNFTDYHRNGFPNSPTICYIGNLYPKSGYDKFAKAWIKIERELPNTRLYIIGGNDLYREKVIQGRYSPKSVNKLNRIVKKAFYKDGILKSNVHFTGVLGGQDKLNIMKQATIGIANLTETGETFGLSLIEFEALGIPVISFNYRGVRETVNNRKTGILVKKNNLANETINLLQNEALIQAMSKNAEIFVRQSFDIKKIGMKWIELFYDLITEGRDLFKKNEIQKKRFLYDNKKYLWINKKLKEKKCLSWLPPISFYNYIIEMCKRILEKINLI